MGVKKAKSREERKIRESRIPIEENLELENSVNWNILVTEGKEIKRGFRK